MRRRENTEMSPALAAARGAAAGLIGGLALIAVDRFVVPRLGGGSHRERDWDEGVAHTLGRVGVRVRGRQRAVVGVATGLAYAALLGAGYGLARQRLRRTPAARGLLDAGLVFGASLISPEPPPRSRGVRGASKRPRLRPVSSAAIFGTTTAAAYKALSRRAG
jgi:hypothetical protein